MAINIKNNFGPVIHNEAGATVNVSTKEALESYEKAVRDGLLVDEVQDFSDSSSAPEYSNNIFRRKLFNTNAKVVRLRDAIGARIKGAKLTDGGGLLEDRPQIDPTKQNEWYYVWKMLHESGLLDRNATRRAFIAQMLDWYPEVFDEVADDEQKKTFVRKMESSISAEKSKWTQGKVEVAFKDMNHKWQELYLNWKSVQPMLSVCKDLFFALQNLKSAIEQEEAAKGVR